MPALLRGSSLRCLVLLQALQTALSVLDSDHIDNSFVDLSVCLLSMLMPSDLGCSSLLQRIRDGWRERAAAQMTSPP